MGSDEDVRASRDSIATASTVVTAKLSTNHLDVIVASNNAGSAIVTSDARNDQYEQQRFSERAACEEVWHDGALDGIDTPHGGQDHEGDPDA